MNWAKLAVELGAELWREWRRNRAAAQRAKEWAEKPAAIRGCPRCHEIAFTPGQVACNKCGAFLAR